MSVGGFISSFADDYTQRRPTSRQAFVRLLQLLRRDRGWTWEEFAKRADVELAELIRLETDEQFFPNPRTVFQIANTVGLPNQKLLALAGLISVKDPTFDDAALKFAARSEPIDRLTPEEQSALSEYVKFLGAS